MFDFIKRNLFFTLFIFLAMPIMVFANDPGAVEVSEMDFIKTLIESVGGVKGAGTLGVVTIVVQVLMKALQTPLIGSWAGKWRLLLVYFLNVAGAVVGLMVVNDLSLGTALLHGNALAAISVFGHQVVKQVQKKE